MKIVIPKILPKYRNLKTGASFKKRRCRKCGKLIFDGNPQMKTCDQCKAFHQGGGAR